MINKIMILALTIYVSVFNLKPANGDFLENKDNEKVEVVKKSSSLTLENGTKKKIILELELKQKQSILEKKPSTLVVPKATPKVSSGVVYAKITSALYGIPKSSIVEILSDRSNGKYYYIKYKGKTHYLKKDYLSIPPNPKTDKSIMSNEQVIAYINSKKVTSKTNFIIFTDINRQKTYFIQKNSSGAYKVIKTTLSATGNNVTPTIRGQFAIQSKRTHLNKKGSEINAMYAMQITGAYYYHSVLTNKFDEISDKTVGRRASHGCIRNPMEVAKWAYQTIPIGTTVLIV
ncbi:L,D-transpeptidase [Peribacillus frigoritolerans]|uniref:L,D-transpeptidase n=1 Tax=Peribacillus frigoritolerans TaxID=450367 RepID=UPI003D29322F